MLKQVSDKRILFCAIIFASLGMAAADFYLPSLPAIMSDLKVSASLSQFSVAVFIIGFALSRLVTGIFSDAVGRKRALAPVLVLFLLGTILCFLSPSISLLIVGRLIQGVGAGGINITGRIILRDQLSGKKLAQYSSYYSMGSYGIIASAPLLGGYVQHYFGWRASFIVIFLFALFAVWVTYFLLPETSHHEKSIKNLTLKSLYDQFKMLFSQPIFLTSAGLLFFSLGVMYAWLTSGPIVLQKTLGLSPVAFGWAAGIVGFFYMFGAYVNSRWVHKTSIQAMFKKGILIYLSGVFLFILPALFHYLSAFALVAPIVIMVFGLAMINPNAFAQALTPFPKNAGMASAFLGLFQFLGGFAASSMMSALPCHNQWSMAIWVIITAIFFLLLHPILTRHTEA